MFTVSLHGIKIHAPIGLYPEEKITGNDFEIDIDIRVLNEGQAELPFWDYSIIYGIVSGIFRPPGDLLESYVADIHRVLKEEFPQADTVRVAIRKLQPPLGGDVRYSMVTLER